MELHVGEKFRLRRKLGSGSFGDVFSGRNAETGEQVAIKLERPDSKRPVLPHEAHVYKALAGEEGVPKMHWFGLESEFNVMVVDRLGPSLQNLFDACDRQFSLKTVLMLADQMITRVEQMHANDYLHRDIKPDNFLIGGHQAGKASLVHIIDFGLAKRYRDRKTKKHASPSDRHSFVGTARFASLNAHGGVEQSRRDDLEAVGHVLAYFLRGDLPWQGFKTENKQEMYEKIKEIKTATSIDELCHGLPEEFAKFLTYCRNLEYSETPDYEYLRDLFRQSLTRHGLQNDGMFDWIDPTSLPRKESPSDSAAAATAAA
jgi:serine/threonine protein kinase